jgi:hypothetical protein
MFITETEAADRLEKSTDLWSIRERKKPVDNGSPISEAPSTDTPEEKEEVVASPEAEPVIHKDALKALDNILDPPKKLGRPKGQGNRSDELRATIGVTSKILGAKGANQLFETGLQTPYANAQGKVSVGGEVKESLITEVKEQQDAIRNIAFNRLVFTLGLMDDDKLSAIQDATKLARVGRDLSTIVDKVTPKAEASSQSVHFHVYKPEARPENSYEVIDLVASPSSQHQLDAHDQ